MTSLILFLCITIFSVNSFKKIYAFQVRLEAYCKEKHISLKQGESKEIADFIISQRSYFPKFTNEELFFKVLESVGEDTMPLDDKSRIVDGINLLHKINNIAHDEIFLGQGYVCYNKELHHYFFMNDYQCDQVLNIALVIFELYK